MLVVADDAHEDHHCLELDGSTLMPSWEGPERAQIVRDALTSAGGHEFVKPGLFAREVVDQLHDPAYVDFLESAWQRWKSEGHEGEAAMAFCWPARRLDGGVPINLIGQLGYYSFAADCSIVEGTWAAVASSAAIAETAAKAVASGGRDVAFALCRPPGHHASKDQYGGYCYLNNAAVAAQVLRNDGHERVGVLDIDYHHGNGTQDIFYERSDVLFASLHADPNQEFPYFLGHASEQGRGAGVGCNRNMPMSHGTEFAAWAGALDAALDWLRDGGIDALVVSVGVDTYIDDPISKFQLRTSDYLSVGERLSAADVPTVLVLEGGYAHEALGQNVCGLIDGFEQFASS